MAHYGPGAGYALARLGLAGAGLAGAALGGAGGMYWAGSKHRRARGVRRARTRRAITSYRRRRFKGRVNKWYRGGSGRELKFHEIGIDDVTQGPTWSTSVNSSLNLIVQGVGESQRIGRKITIRKVTTHLHVFINAPTNNAITHDTLIICLMLDTQANGGNPAIGDIVENTTDYQSFRNLSNKGRFITLWRRQFNMHAPAAAGDGTTNLYTEMGQDVTISHNCSIPIEYDLTTGVISAVQSNNLFILAVTAHDLMGYRTFNRIRFTG